MAQSRRGVNQMLEVLMHPSTKAIPRFIQMNMPLLLLKCINTSSIWFTPRLDWAISLKDSKGTNSWINLGTDAGGVNAPVDKGYTKIYSNEHTFATLKADGSIKAWGDPFTGGESAPTDKGYTKIYSNKFAFAALKADGYAFE
jgi:hypothetical protein